jgi:hypothetical protein
LTLLRERKRGVSLPAAVVSSDTQAPLATTVTEEA